MCCPQLLKVMSLFTCSNCGQLLFVPGSVSWCVPPADWRDTRFHPAGGRTGEASPFPRVFCAGEVCCLLSAKECLCFYGLGDSCPNFCCCDTAQEPPQFQLQLGHVSFQPFWLQVRYLVTWKHQWGHWGLRIKMHLPFLWSLRVLCVQEGPDFIQVYQKLVCFWALHLYLLPALLSG